MNSVGPVTVTGPTAPESAFLGAEATFQRTRLDHVTRGMLIGFFAR